MEKKEKIKVWFQFEKDNIPMGNSIVMEDLSYIFVPNGAQELKSN